MKDFIRYAIAIACVLYMAIPAPEPRPAPLEPSEPVVEVVATPLPATPLEAIPEPVKEVAPVSLKTENRTLPTAQYRAPVRYYTAPQTCSGPNCQPQSRQPTPQGRQGILRRWRRS
jgi:hypothetical protein